MGQVDLLYVTAPPFRDTQSVLPPALANRPGVQLYQSAAEALAALRNGERPALVVVDLELLYEAGVELCRLIRTCPAPPTVLMLAGDGQEELAAQSLRAGASACIRKSAAHVWERVLAATTPPTADGPAASDTAAMQRSVDELRRAEEWLRTVVQSAPVILFAFDTRGICTFVEGRALRTLGLAHLPLVGRSIFAVTDDLPAFEDSREVHLIRENVRRALEGEEFSTHTDLGGRAFETRYTPMRAADGAVVGTVGISVDVTEQREAERARRAAQEQLKTVIAHAPLVLFALDGDGYFTLSEGSGLALLGLRPGEAVGRSAFEMYAAYPDVLEPLHTALKGRATTRRARIGDIVFEVHYAPLINEEGQVSGVIGVAYDQSDRARAEQALRESQEQFRLLAEHARDVFWTTDADFRFTYVSPAAERLFGFPPEQALGRHLLEAVGPSGRTRDLDELLRQGATGELDELVFEAPHITSTGDSFWCEVSMSTVRDEQGRLVALQGVTRDIRERKAAEDAVRESEARYRLLASQLRDVIWAMDAAGQFTYMSPAVERLLGYTPEEWVGRNVLDGLFTEETTTFIMERLADATEGVVSELLFETPMIAKNGERLWTEVSASVLRDVDGRLQAIHGTTRDITDRKRAESELRFTQFAIDRAGDAMFWMTEDASFIYVNDAACRSLGYTRADLLQMSVFDIDPDMRRDQWPQVWEAAKLRRTFRMESTHRRRDGERFPVEISVNFVEYDGTGYNCAIVRDMTERRQAEYERLQLEAQVQHTQKLESLGVLAGGIAHDFNNLLVGVMGNAGVMLAELPGDSPLREYVTRIETAATRAAELTNQLLAYTGKGAVMVQPLDLRDLVQEMMHLLETAISKKAELHCEFAQRLPAVEGDPSQLRQIVMNLMTNASDALGDEPGRITIRIDAIEVTEAELRDSYLAPELEGGEYVLLRVTDTGCGMTPETVQRIFDPFFTTKFMGRGLGLAAVLGIVRGHQGALKVDTAPGRGTTFTVLLPASTREPPRVAVPEGGRVTPKRTGTILVVDDEETVRDVAGAILEQAGYRVVTAVDGMEAVDMFRRHAGDITAVLLDMTMPGMDGVEAFRAIRRLRSDAPIILSSGYTEQDATRELSGQGLAGFVQKPYRPDTLLAKIETVLSQ